MQVISKKPLSVDEINCLNEFLCAPYENSSPMSFTKAHGFLTAVNTCPHIIMPSVWQSELFGGCPEFNSEEQVHTIMDLILRLYNQINDELRQQAISFLPVIVHHNKIIPYQKASLALIGEWCDWYAEGIRLDPVWLSDEEEILTEETFPPLVVIGILAGYLDIKGVKDDEGKIIKDDAPYKEKLRELLPEFIVSFFNYWEEAREYSTTHSGEEEPYVTAIPETEGDDSCDCGSGKKYKECCALMRPTFH